jgi:hypothetical protein
VFPILRLAIFLTTMTIWPFCCVFGGDLEAFRQVILECREFKMIGQGPLVDLNDILRPTSFMSELFSDGISNLEGMVLPPEKQRLVPTSPQVLEKLRRNRENYHIRLPIYFTVSLAWLGSYFYPLDWDEPWQLFPLPNVACSLLGFIIGSVLIIFF